MEQKKLDERLAMRLDKATKEAFVERAKAEKRTVSELLLMLVEEYLRAVPHGALEEKVDMLQRKVEYLESAMLGKSAA